MAEELKEGWARFGARVDVAENEPVLFLLMLANAWRQMFIEEGEKSGLEVMPDSLLMVIKPRDSFRENAPEEKYVALLLSMIGRKKPKLIVPAVELPKG